MDRPTGRDTAALRRTVGDAATPWTEVAAAVRALGRAGEEEQEYATRTLLDRELSLLWAEEIAEAMTDYAAPHRAAVAERLRGPASATGAFDEQRIQAALALAALGPEYRDEAVGALRGAIADPQTGQPSRYRAAQLRWTAALALAQTDPELRDEAAEVIRREDLANDGWENELARAEHLHELGGAWAEEARRMLLALREQVDEEFAVDVDLALEEFDESEDSEDSEEDSADGSGVPGLLSPEESAAQLRARIQAGQGERGDVFVALSDQAGDQIWNVLRPVEFGSVKLTCKELTGAPRSGRPSPGPDASTEDYVVELNPKQRHHRPVTLHYRYHPELEAVLVLTLVVDA
ncbi:hypothetical protein ABT247_25790 [Kitasatospora sp. NPDC001539]|uniref:hypothetical protein n=1 Tax=Kitasatospora sp. NPDC001539 TaxID=3154384 RepID=UPI00331D9C44